MVTIDNIVRNVPEFNGDLKGNRVFYEAAVQGLDRICKEEEKFRGALKAKTGYTSMNLPPEEGDRATYAIGDAVFNVKSEARIKRPAYAEAAQNLEGHLEGIGYLVGTGRRVSHVLDNAGQWYIDAERLEEDFAIMVERVRHDEVKHTITHEAKGKLVDRVANPAGIAEVTVPDMSRYGKEAATAYVQLAAIKPGLERFVASYESALDAKLQDINKKIETDLVEVGGGEAYKVKKSVAKGADWAFVVKTLMKIEGVKDCVGELNTLADQTMTVAQKRARLPHYQLMEVEVPNKQEEGRTEERTYVSLKSVYQRIQDLKAGQSVIAQRQQVDGIRVV